MTHPIFGKISLGEKLWSATVTSPTVGYPIEIEGSAPLPTDRETVLWQIIEQTYKNILESAPALPVETSRDKCWRSPNNFDIPSAKISWIVFFADGNFTSMHLESNFKSFVKTPCLEIKEDGTVNDSYWSC